MSQAKSLLVQAIDLGWLFASGDPAEIGCAEVNVSLNREDRAALVAADINQARRRSRFAAGDVDTGEAGSAAFVAILRIDGGLREVRAEHAQVKVACRKRTAIPQVLNRSRVNRKSD